MQLIVVFLLSVSAFAFEVLLTRIFSISQWNHLAFMVISIALFGFAASGTLLCIMDARSSGGSAPLPDKDRSAVILMGYSLSAAGSFIGLNRIPLDYVKLPIEPIQALYLLVAYLLLALPFFFAGLAICTAYRHHVHRTGTVYFVNMAGSAIGAVTPAVLLPILSEGKTMLLVSLLPMVLFPHLLRKTERKPLPYIAGAAVIILTACAILLVSPNASWWMHIAPSPYKALSQMLRFPETRIVETRTGIRGRMDRVESPYIRFAPGLSLKFTGTLPKQEAIFTDGDAPLIRYRLGCPGDSLFSKYTLSYAGYLLPERIDRVLVILEGGGSAIACAVAAGADHITVLEKNPYLADLLGTRKRFSVVTENARSFLARNRKDFAIVHVENWGASLPGTSALEQSYLYTVEAFADYLNALGPDGAVILSRKLLLPPTDSIRLWAGAYEGLKKTGARFPEKHLALLRNWDTYSLIISKKPIAGKSPLVSFAADMNFDMVYLSDAGKWEPNRFNLFDAPFHFHEISRLANAYRSGTEAIYFKNHPFDIAPQHANRPFPNRHLKWSRLKTAYQSTGSRIYYIFLSGEIVVAVVLIEAIGISLLLIGIPAAANRKTRRPPFSICLFFLGAGAGFMFVELYFIKLYTALTGNTIVSFTLVLSGLLISSSAGGFWSQRLKRKNLGAILFSIMGLLAMSALLNPLIVNRLFAFTAPLRLITGLLLLAPIGFLMGIPFPIGMRLLLDTASQRAFGWALNGCASVLAAITAAQVALSLGIDRLLFCALMAYAAMLAGYRNFRS